MGARHADRLWMIGGAFIIVALTVISWFFVINPKYAEADEVARQAADTEVQISVLNKRLAELEKQKSKLPTYTAQLKASQAALPSDSGVPDFLRSLQSAGDDLDVTVGGVSVSAASAVNGFSNVYALPITLTLEGSPENLGKFLTQLQQTQPRAVLINSATLTAQDGEDAADDSADSSTGATTGSTAGASTGSAATPKAGATISLSLRAFVAVPAGQGAPQITTTPTK